MIRVYLLAAVMVAPGLAQESAPTLEELQKSARAAFSKGDYAAARQSLEGA